MAECSTYQGQNKGLPLFRNERGESAGSQDFGCARWDNRIHRSHVEESGQAGANHRRGEGERWGTASPPAPRAPCYGRRRHKNDEGMKTYATRLSNLSDGRDPEILEFQPRGPTPPRPPETSAMQGTTPRPPFSLSRFHVQNQVYTSPPTRHRTPRPPRTRPSAPSPLFSHPSPP
jgi:hypothetical protein